MKKIFILIAGFSVLSFIVISHFPSKTTAADLSQFNPGRIIDDSVFTNNNSMSAQDIQNFLNQKNSVCLKDFRSLSLIDDNGDGVVQDSSTEQYGPETMSAAELIKAAANIYKINPQVILVTLQKEQGLITRQDCPDWRYNTALGYGCPDTAPCNQSAFGFTRQIDYGTYHFRGFFDDTLSSVPYGTGNTRVYYHPSLDACSSSIINIQNRATAALYNYTPYQPNASSLAAGYGQGDSCASYGNRNFYNYFNDWFGSTQGTPFFQLPNIDKTFIMGANNTYYFVPSYDVLLAYGFGSSFGYRVTKADSNFTENLEYKGNLPLVARFEGDGVYAIGDGRLHQFPSPTVLSDYGYSFGQEATLPKWMLYNLPSSSPVQNILKLSDSPTIYYVSGGTKQPFCSWGAYTTTGSPIYSSRGTVTISRLFTNSIPNGKPIAAEGDLIRTSDSGSYGIWHQNQLTPFDSTVANTSGVPSCITTTPLLQQYSTNSLEAKSLVKNASGSLFMINYGQKISLQPSALANLGLSPDDFVLVTDAFLNKLTSTAFKPLFRKGNNSAVNTVLGGKQYWISSRDDLHALGYTLNDVQSLMPVNADLFTPAGSLYKPGRLVRIGNEAAVHLLDADFKRYTFPSSNIFLSYGYSWSDVVSVSSDSLQSYTGDSQVSRFVKDSEGKYYLVDSGVMYETSASLASASNYNADSYAPLTLTSDAIKTIKASRSLTRVFRAPNTSPVYVIENGSKRHITSPSALFSLGYTWSDVIPLSTNYIDSLPNGSPVN